MNFLTDKFFFRVAFTCCIFFTGLSSFSVNDVPAIVKDVFNETNEFRVAEGLPELQNREDLNEIARKHSEDMAKGKVEFGHDGFEDRNDLVKKKITGIKSFAENVAYGVNTGAEVVNLWKKSPPHRRNMLGHYNYIGIGVAKDGDGKIFYTQIFAGQ